MSTTRHSHAQRSPLAADVLYGIAGALATLTLVTAVLAAVTSRTPKHRAAPDPVKP